MSRRIKDSAVGRVVVNDSGGDLRKFIAAHSCVIPVACYRRLHLPVNARAKNMFSRDVKRLSFRCQTLKFSRPNVWFTLFS